MQNLLTLLVFCEKDNYLLVLIRIYIVDFTEVSNCTRYFPSEYTRGYILSTAILQTYVIYFVMDYPQWDLFYTVPRKKEQAWEYKASLILDVKSKLWQYYLLINHIR